MGANEMQPEPDRSTSSAPAVVGRQRELTLLRAAVQTGRDIVLEGPPGTSKTTMLRNITESWGVPLFFVEGNADLTATKLIGHHNPARVMREDYTLDNFVPGPLVRAMQAGGFLYVEEINRAPEDALNILLTVMGERRITVPRVATFVADPTFRVVASMNPIDDVGTTRLSMGMHDRFCRLVLSYQDEAAERSIVSLRIAADLAGHDPILVNRAVEDAVAVTRATRAHPDVRQGSSVRGAIDAVLLALNLTAQAASSPDATLAPQEQAAARYDDLMLDALLVALSGRIRVDEAAETTPESIVRALWQDQLLRRQPAGPG